MCKCGQRERERCVCEQYIHSLCVRNCFISIYTGVCIYIYIQRERGGGCTYEDIIFTIFTSCICPPRRSFARWDTNPRRGEVCGTSGEIYMCARIDIDMDVI